MESKTSGNRVVYVKAENNAVIRAVPTSKEVLEYTKARDNKGCPEPIMSTWKWLTN